MVTLVVISVENTENISTVGFVLLAFLALYIILLFVWALASLKAFIKDLRSFNSGMTWFWLSLSFSSTWHTGIYY